MSSTQPPPSRHPRRAARPHARWPARRAARESTKPHARRSPRAAAALVLSAALLAAATLTAPTALARPADPGPASAIPRPAPRPAPVTTRPAASRPAPTGDLSSVRAEATRLRTKLDGQHRRLELLAEELEEAYARGVELLADASGLDRRRIATERELASPRPSWTSGPAAATWPAPAGSCPGWSAPTTRPTSWPGCPCSGPSSSPTWLWWTGSPRIKAKLDRTRSRLSERLVDQARGAEQLNLKRAEAERLAAEIERELRTMDGRVAALIEKQRRREEASQRAAFADYLAAARTAGTAPARDGRASSAARKAVEVALAQLGSPYVWGAEGPSTFDCSGLTSFAYAATGVTIPRVSRAQFAAYAASHPVAPTNLLPGDLVFFADDPRVPSTIHHVGMYIGKGLMVEAPHTGAVVRTSSIWRPSYAGAVRPAP